MTNTSFASPTGELLADQTVRSTTGDKSSQHFFESAQPESTHYEVGTMIAGKYRVISELGKGGMGVVYKVVHELLGTTHAIKVMHRHLSGDPHSVQRFQIEAKAATALRHENLLTVTDFGLTDTDQPYIVMDCISGESLSDKLKRSTLTITEFVDIFSQVCRGLEEAHEQGIIHRDLKPSNIMLTDRFGVLGVKIVDFGIAKLTSEDKLTAQHLTQTGEIFGSPLYMSPEQCRGSRVDSRTDIFSIGCAMFEALVGEPPLRGASAVETMFKRISENAPLINSVSSKQFDHELEDVVAKTLENDPDLRFQNFSEVIEALSKYGFHQKLPKAARSRFETAHKRSERTQSLSKSSSHQGSLRRMAAVIGAVSTVLVIVAAMSNMYLSSHHHSEAAPAATAPAYTSAEKDAGLKHAEELVIVANSQSADSSFEQALESAKQALALREKFQCAPTLVAESLDQVATLIAQVENAKFESDVNPSKYVEAEALLHKAIDLSPTDTPSTFNSGRAKYRLDLVDVLLKEDKVPDADKLLTSVWQDGGYRRDNLRELNAGDISNLALMNAVKNTDMHLKNYEEAAYLTARIAYPEANMDTFTHTNQPSFTGHWKIAGEMDDYGFDMNLTQNKKHITGEVTCITHKTDDGVVDGNLSNSKEASVTWTSGWAPEGTHGTAQLTRVGEYLVWTVTESQPGSLMFFDAVMRRTQ